MRQTQPQQAFGLHLTLDGYDCLREPLINLDQIYRFLHTCPDLIQMTKIMPPYAFKYQGKVAGDWGLSGFVLIAESHISIHTFPDRNYLSLDIFSCKKFDIEEAISYAVDLFGIGRHEKNIFDRGLEFPRDQEIVTEFLESQRQEL
jgi:S-adenosylmethionine decarboxylase